MACTGETMQPLPAGTGAGNRQTAQPDDSAPSDTRKVRGPPRVIQGTRWQQEPGVERKMAGAGLDMCLRHQRLGLY